MDAAEQLSEIIAKQTKERADILEEIKRSKHPKKIIVAGPGTGKTYTFLELLKTNQATGKRVAITFIKKLVDEMQIKLASEAESHTLHHYCKMLLHQRISKFELIEYLPKVIESDALVLGLGFTDFDSKLQNIEEGREIIFYLTRSDCYKAVCFDDCLYRLFCLMRDDPKQIPNHELILIDEFQDFNPLEVAIIEFLEQKANIVIVGDDDQAIYSTRNSSPEHIRKFWNRKDYKKFTLPHCSRCTKVIVEVVNAIIESSKANKKLVGRIDEKRYECFIDKKIKDSNAFSKIISIQVPTVKSVTKFIQKEIENIPEPEIKESLDKEDPYPTILVVGSGKYLKPIYRQISLVFPKAQYKPSVEYNYDLLEGYKELIKNSESNLGWRILCEFLLRKKIFKELLEKSYSEGSLFLTQLDKNFVQKQIGTIELIRKIINSQDLTDEQERFIVENSKLDLGALYSKFAPITLEEEKPTEQKIEPTILFTSFEGCKGLSAGRVFIVGMNNGDFPINPANVTDIEISKLIVALTRTRKCCYLISNKGIGGLYNRNGEYLGKDKSIFYKWIPDKLIEDLGYKKINDI